MTETTEPSPPALPLSGVRVLEFASMLSGPFAGLLLGLLGAEVIKVERLGGDPFRGYGGFSTHFANFNAGKKSVVADLRTPAGHAAVLRLIAASDVLLENSRPGQMGKLGLSENDCHAVNPGLIYVGISGFGSKGPWAERPAYDAIGQAMSGLMDTMTNGAAPSVGPALGDIVSGMVGASAALAGLAGRGLRGVGATVRTSMFEALTCAVSDALLHYSAHGTERTRADRATRSQVFSLLCADDRYLMIQLSSSQRFFVNLVNAVGRPDVASDERFASYDARMENQPAMEEILAAIFREQSSAFWEEELSKADVPSGPVLRISDVVGHPHTEALQLLSPPGPDGLRRYRGPWTVDGQRPPAPQTAPVLGEHTRAVFAGLLGEEAAKELLAVGALMDASQLVDD
jgi:crotonobetainyl-CoA:carnitine CoA-transferase CaiB-like acyl-CoA transferase